MIHKSILYCITILFSILQININAQNLSTLLSHPISYNDSEEMPMAIKAKSDMVNTGVNQFFKNWNNTELDIKKQIVSNQSTSKNGDTLYIGETANDSVVITGTWVHNGPIFIIGDGKLVFNNANATIIGDIWVWGDHAKLIATNSTLYIPQQYFYQRSLVAAGKGQFIFDHSTLDFSGLSHNFVATDSAQFILKNVIKNGFTTNGLSKNATILIDTTNLAGEFICTDEINLTCKHANTILLWHHIPYGASLSHSFPSPDTVSTYHFSSTTPGVDDIHYSINIDTCTDVMWALMPASGSTTVISNSTIKAIGIWFENSGSINVSGFTNNSFYSDFLPIMSDKYIRLINCNVKIWNLYTFNQSEIVLSGSIVGEIGSMGKSKITCQNSMIDGSGGYTWATDTTVLIVGYSSVVNDFRANKNSFAIFSYSSLLNGIAMANDNAIMIINQSSTPDFPIAYGNSCVWYNKIEQPSTGYQNSIINIVGSSYIEKTPTSPWMDFSWYQVYYKSNNDTNWISITDKITTPVKDNTLAQWNTNSLAPDNYLIKLVLCDNTIDSNKVEAIKSINILPSFLAVSVDTKQNPSIVYRQNLNTLIVNNSLIGRDLSIFDMKGILIHSQQINQSNIILPKLAQGLYIASIKNMNFTLKFESIQ